MKKTTLSLISFNILLLTACSFKGTTHSVSNMSQSQRVAPVNTVLTALSSLENQNTQKYHELTSFQMANDYKVSYIASDPFASSPFENFLTLQYMSALIEAASYEVTDYSEVGQDASVSIQLAIPNFENTLNQSLPHVIQTYRQEYATMNMNDLYAKTSLLTTINAMIQSSFSESEESTEMINTFKLKYIEGSWYIVDNGELYNQIHELVQYYNRQL